MTVIRPLWKKAYCLDYNKAEGPTFDTTFSRPAIRHPFSQFITDYAFVTCMSPNMCPYPVGCKFADRGVKLGSEALLPSCFRFLLVS